MSRTIDNNKRFIIIVLGIALALRLFRLSAQSLWVDEMFTVIQGDPKPGYNIFIYLKNNIHGPLHAAVIYLFERISMGDAWLRLPSALAGVGAVYYMYRWVAVWLGERVARWSALLMAIHPLHIFYSQEVRAYSFLLFFVCYGLYRFQLLLTDDRRGNYVRYGVAVAAAALSSFTAAFLYVANAVLFLFRRGVTRRRVRNWALVSLLILLLISPWVYRIYQYVDVSELVTPVMLGEVHNDERLRGGTTVTPIALPYTMYVFSVGFSFGPSTRDLHHDRSVAGVIREHGLAIAWVTVLFGTVLLAGGSAFVRRRYPLWQMVAYLLIPIVLTLLLSWQNAKVFNVRYVLVSFPPFLALLATGLLAMSRMPRRVALVLIAATLLYSLGNYYFDGDYSREDVRGAVRYIAANDAAGDCIMAPVVWELVEHYYDGNAAVTPLFARPSTARSSIERQFEKNFANCDRVWYLRTREWVADAHGHIPQVISSRYELEDVVEFNGVMVFLYTR